MHRLCHILLFLLPMISVGQNLVPNPSFEDNYGCPFLSGQIGDKAAEWFNYWGGCDYYHECGTNGYGIPANVAGGGYARTGSAYGQITLYSPIVDNGREMIGIELYEPLDSAMKYNVDFYISLQDSANYAVRNVGALFTNQSQINNVNSLLSQSPQVRYSEMAFLDDKHNWMHISGTFTSEGGERFLVIGNFDSDNETDSISVSNGGSVTGNPEGYWDFAGYFIDDVSVVKDTTYHVGIQESEFTFSIYPNPATTSLTIESRTPLARVWVRDVAGRPSIHHPLVADGTQDDRVVIDISSLPSGIYLVEVLTQNGQRSVQKVVVE